MKRTIIFTVLLLCLSILLTAFGTQKEQNLVLRIGGMEDFKSSGSARTLVFDPLTRLDKDLKPIPYLVSWEADEQQKKFKLNVTKDVKFHDGTALNADIVRWNIETLGALYYCGYADYLEKVDVNDDLTLTVSFKQSYPLFPEELATIPVMPIDNMSEDYTIASFNGTGPYRLEEYVENQTTKLKRNENYWNKEKKPKITEVDWVPIADGAARVMAVTNDQVDVVGLTDGYNAFSFNLLRDLEKNDSVSMIVEPAEQFTSANSLGLNWQKGVLEDVNLRAVICYGINREPLVKNILFGIPQVVEHYIGGAYWDAPEHFVEGIGYDLEKSNEFLEKGGYKRVNGKITKDGKPIKLDFVVRAEDEQNEVGQYIKAELEKLGFECNLIILEPTQAFERQKKLEYDVTISWPWYEPVAASLPSMGLSKEYQGMGLGGLVDEKMLDYADEFYKAKNRDEAKVALQKIWETQYDNYLAAPLYATTRVIIHNKKYDGYFLDGSFYQVDLSDIHLAK